MAEFDRLALVYDEAVASFEEEELEAVREALHHSHCQLVLDVGVGTGRISEQLDAHYEMIGIDVSMPMLARARSKGIENLVLADAKYLPFRDKAFDAAILVDVLNCLDNPVTVFAQVSLATDGRIIAIKRKYDRDGSEELDDPKFARLRNRVQGYLSESQTCPRPKSWEKEDSLVDLFPLLERRVVSDRIIVTSAESMISRLEKGAFRFTSDIPADELRYIAEQLRHEMEGTYFQRRRIREMVVWDTRLFQIANLPEY
ncbi:MAG: class I SAM-dependent methyltransferase [Nitrososphaerota archaeon]|nr:class I SAM-dependent methyltransferase [Nitrososphaerota archaeon]MDG6923560.1 class I SAM-dependent methyltransferase [Nitrososphaerota archaeon]